MRSFKRPGISCNTKTLLCSRYGLFERVLEFVTNTDLSFEYEQVVAHILVMLYDESSIREIRAREPLHHRSPK